MPSAGSSQMAAARRVQPEHRARVGAVRGGSRARLRGMTSARNCLYLRDQGCRGPGDERKRIGCGDWAQRSDEDPRPGHAKPHRRHADHRGRDPVRGARADANMPHLGGGTGRQGHRPARGARGAGRGRRRSPRRSTRCAPATPTCSPRVASVQRTTTSPPTRWPRPSGSGIDVRADARAILATHYAQPRGRAERGAAAHGAHPRRRGPDRQPGVEGARLQPRQRARHGRGARPSSGRCWRGCCRG